MSNKKIKNIFIIFFLIFFLIINLYILYKNLRESIKEPLSLIEVTTINNNKINDLQRNINNVRATLRNISTDKQTILQEKEEKDKKIAKEVAINQIKEYNEVNMSPYMDVSKYITEVLIDTNSEAEFDPYLPRDKNYEEYVENNPYDSILIKYYKEEKDKVKLPRDKTKMSRYQMARKYKRNVVEDTCQDNNCTSISNYFYTPNNDINAEQAGLGDTGATVSYKK